MRVIAGTAKGRKLVTPKGLITRPTPSRVREALFSIIAAHVPHARVLDLYAGTGALGIESMSRGAAHGVFIERDRHVLDCLRRNVAPFAAACELLNMAVMPGLKLLAQRQTKFDLIFMDPPYPANLWAETLKGIATHALLGPDGIVVCEHPSAGPALQCPEQLTCVRTRAFGEVTLSLFAQP